MKTTFAAVALVAATGAAAASNSTVAPVYVTEVVTAYTTYCPAATMITHGNATYTVTAATTLTISDCPCTITKPASSVGTSAASVQSASSVVVAPYTYSNGTVATSSVAGAAAGTAAMTSTKATSAVSGAASGTGSATKSSTPATFSGAASAMGVPAGLAAIMGLAAYAL